MQEYLHAAFQVAGYKVTITNPKDAQNIIQGAWQKFISEEFIKKVEHKVYPHVYAIYYNYHDIGNFEQFGYDMLLGFVIEEGTAQSNPQVVTVQIHAQDYKFFKVEGDLRETVQIEWATINSLPISELDRDYGYDMDMYSKDNKTCTIAVSVNK